MHVWGVSQVLGMAMIIVAATVSASAEAQAGTADVIAAAAMREAEGTWRLTVTVEHADTGWEHYADAWEVVAPDGTVLGTRVLMHPHVDEQPFTRSLGGVQIPDSVSEVTVRARDSVHGFGGREIQIMLPR